MNAGARDLLSEYALGTLEPDEAAAVEALLARSADARAELRALRAALVGLTEGLPPAQPPAHVWEQVRARLGADAPAAPPPRPRLTYLGWALAACLALVALGQGLWLGQTGVAYREAAREARLVADFLALPDVQTRTLYGRTREGIGGVLSRPDGSALFVLEEAPAPGRSYQAWGHTNDDWTPGSDARLTSLGRSDRPIFEVPTRDFAALYLSLEPGDGSPQPTYPLSRVSLAEPAAASPLEVVSPTDGAVVHRASVIVSGRVDPSVTRLSYVIDGVLRQVVTAGGRFSFTAPLERGENTLTLRAQGARGTATETLTLTRP